MMFNSMTNKAIALEIGTRIEQIRLEQNRTQKELADEIGLTPVSYRNLVAGKGKFENLIALLRALGRVDLLESFIPDSEFSPMERLRLQGRKRQRASGGRVENASDQARLNPQQSDLDW